MKANPSPQILQAIRAEGVELELPARQTPHQQLVNSHVRAEMRRRVEEKYADWAAVASSCLPHGRRPYIAANYDLASSPPAHR